MESHGEVFAQLLVLLAGSVALVVLLNRLALPSLLAFLAVGVACGPGGWHLIESHDAMAALAEFGVVFLLFTLGLEFSLPRLLALRSTVFGIGSLQVLLCGGAFLLVALASGLGLAAAVVVAGGLALSSTAVVSRELVATRQLHTRHGQIAIGILLFQDIVAVFLLILVPVLAGAQGEGLLAGAGEALLRGGLLVLVMLAAGRWLLPRLLEESAAVRSEELFMLTALLVALLAAWVTQLAGLSMELGAFLGGMVLGESRFRHQVNADIRPFRDLLLGLFFVSVGMLLDPRVLLAYWPVVLLGGAALILTKFVLVTAMTRALRETDDTALRTGLALAQGGEFFFALLALATRETLLDAGTASVLVAITATSMVATPLLLRHSEAIASRLAPYLPGQRHADEPPPDLGALLEATADMHRHVVVLGYGRVGQTIARFLTAERVPWVALDSDVVRVRQGAREAVPVYFGDPLRRDILHAASIDQAALVVVSFDDVPTALRIIQSVRECRADVPILVRTRDDLGLDALKQAGATEVVPETLEASLMLVSHMFMLLGMHATHVGDLLHEARRQRYRLLHGGSARDDAEAGPP